MFNVLRRRATVSAAAAVSTVGAPCQPLRLRFLSNVAFVPPDSLTNLDGPPSPPRRRSRTDVVEKVKPKPASPTFYTGRSQYYDRYVELEKAVTATRQILKALELNPLPQFARNALPPLKPVWKGRLAMGQAMHSRLSTSRYRRFITLLDVLENYRNIATVTGMDELVGHITSVVSPFERPNKEAVLAHGKTKPVKFDEYGRSYTIGRRKESTARVWIIPVKVPKAESEPVKAPQPNQKNKDIAAFLPILPAEKPEPKVIVPTSNVLINNTPLNEYFPMVVDRERVIRPFKVTGLLGAYNVFAIVRGGGTTGQSGAVTLGVAKGLAAHLPEVEPILRKAKLMRRDPRMVERKKTGLAKARKAYSWVKR